MNYNQHKKAEVECLGADKPKLTYHNITNDELDKKLSQLGQEGYYRFRIVIDNREESAMVLSINNEAQ